MKKIWKWTRRIFFTLLGIIFLIKLLSTLLFSIQMNTGYKQYRWKGYWKSAEQNYTSGYLISNLPYSLPINKRIKSDAILFNHFYTFEHTYSKEKLSLEGILFHNKGNNGGVTLNDSLSIEFQAALIGNKGHQLELNGSVNLTRTIITGSYRAVGPGDAGTFTLSRR